jgi:hypothetical protein
VLALAGDGAGVAADARLAVEEESESGHEVPRSTENVRTNLTVAHLAFPRYQHFVLAVPRRLLVVLVPPERRARLTGVARLLIVHHSPTPRLGGLLETVMEGTAAPGIDGVEVRVCEALDAGVSDVLDADGYLLGTPANLGYMSGALKHFFDVTYNEAHDVTAGRPYGLWVHGESDTTGAIAGVERIITGLGWRAAAEPVSIIGELDDTSRAALWELGATLAATLMPD